MRPGRPACSPTFRHGFPLPHLIRTDDVPKHILAANYVASLYTVPSTTSYSIATVEKLHSILVLLLKRLNQMMKHERLLEHITGNPRSLKRICNITMFSIHCCPDRVLVTKESTLNLLLVIIMVEQWPFR